MLFGIAIAIDSTGCVVCGGGCVCGDLRLVVWLAGAFTFGWYCGMLGFGDCGFWVVVYCLLIALIVGC